MDSIESLRKMDDDELIALGNGQYGRDYRHGRIADEIEAEIAEKYMLLPVDADGMPIHVGDEITLPNGKWDTVRFITYRIADVVFNERGWVPNLCTHAAKPRTIEDVLEDFLIAFDDWDWNTDGDDRDVLRKELLSKYANIIKGLE